MIAGFAWVAPTDADVRSWDNPAGGVFSTGSNWSGNVVPGADDAAVFPLNASYVVGFTNSPTNDQLIARAGTVSIALNPSGTRRTYTLTNPTASIVLGQNAGEFGRVVVNGGTLNGTRAILGGADNASGLLTIASTATLNLSNQLRIGDFASNSRGTVTLNGAARASDLIVGLDGQGTMTVAGSAALADLSDDVFIGNDTSGVGVVTLSAGGRLLAGGSSARLVVGNLGRGTLNVGASSTVQTSGDVDVAVGSAARGDVSVTGAGASLSIGGGLHVGGSSTAAGGTATFNLINGAATVSGATKVWGGGELVLQGGSFTTSRLDVVGGRARVFAAHELDLTSGVIHASAGGRIEQATGAFEFNGHDVTVTGPGSAWTGAANFPFDVDGGSTVRVLAGAALTTPTNTFNGALVGGATGTGTVLIDGAGSTWNSSAVTVADDGGSATVTIAKGAVVNATSAGTGNATRVGFDGAGTMLVTGSGSRLTTGTLDVAFVVGATGHLSIRDGARVDSTAGRLGVQIASAGTVNVGSAVGSDTVWNVAGPLNLANGFSGATLTVSNAGLVRAQSASVNGGGNVLVDVGGRLEVSTVAAGSNAFGVTVGAGAGGVGSMTINGGRVTCEVDVTVASGVGSAGTLRLLNDASWTSGSVSHQVGSRGAGTLAVLDGADLFTNGTMTIGAGTAGSGNVTVSGPGSTLRVGNALRLGAGSSAIADLHVADGAVLTTAQSTFMGASAESVARFIVNGGTWNAGGGVFVGGNEGPSGEATLTISGGVMNAATTVNVGSGGIVVFHAGALNVGETLDVSRGGQVALTAASPSKVLRTGALAIDSASGSRVNLTNNALVVDYSGASPIESIVGLLTEGYAGGSWLGSGLTSSSAANNAGHALGYAEAAALSSVPALFGAVDATAVLVRFTRYGDANLDQNVNLQDFNRLASNFGATGTAVWSQGDFNFDRNVNLQDFNRLAANFGLGAAGPDAPTPQDWAALAARVPEPGPAAGLASLAGLVVSRHRRGRKKN